jgi:hypothetical protein
MSGRVKVVIPYWIVHVIALSAMAGLFVLALTVQ